MQVERLAVDVCLTRQSTHGQLVHALLFDKLVERRLDSRPRFENASINLT